MVYLDLTFKASFKIHIFLTVIEKQMATSLSQGVWAAAVNKLLFSILRRHC